MRTVFLLVSLLNYFDKLCDKLTGRIKAALANILRWRNVWTTLFEIVAATPHNITGLVKREEGRWRKTRRLWPTSAG